MTRFLLNVSLARNRNIAKTSAISTSSSRRTSWTWRPPTSCSWWIWIRTNSPASLSWIRNSCSTSEEWKQRQTKKDETIIHLSLSLSSSSSYFFCTSRLSDAFVIFLEFSFLPRLVCSLNNGIPHPELSFYFARVPSKRNTVDQPFVVLIISWYCYLWRAIIFLEYIRRWRNIRAALPAPFYWKQRFLTENTGHQDKKFQLIVKGTNRKK